MMTIDMKISLDKWKPKKLIKKKLVQYLKRAELKSMYITK